MRKVLFVVDEKKMGGVSILLTDILNKINLNKYQVDIAILHNNGDCLNDLDKRVKIIYGTDFFEAVDYTIGQVLKRKNIKLLFSKIRLVFFMKTGLIRKKIVKERKKMFSKKYDVEVAFKDGFTAIFTAYGDSLKKYHWLHTDYKMFDFTAKYHKLFNDVFMKFDKIIGISEPVVERFKEKYKVNNIDVIYNYVNTDKIREMALLEKFNGNKEKINLVSVGRICEMKGYDRLIEVIHKLDEEKKADKLVLRIIGDGPDYEELKNKVKNYNLDDKILLLGQMANPFPIVKDADYYVMCSRYEAFGLVVVEALTLGVPVFSLEEASIHQIMDDRYGIIEENSEVGLYNGINKIIDGKIDYNRIKKNLKSYNYDTNEIILKIENLLDE